MKYYRLNQIAMAVLGALLLFFGTRTIINIAFEEPESEKPGLEVAGTEEKPAEAEKPDDKAAPEVLALIATADPAQGETDAALCKVCHTFDKGGAAMIGPNLYGVVGRKIASVEGFNYSPALKGKEGEWTYEKIDAFIHNPQTYAPGTMMAFPGVPDVKKRANILAFLRSKSDTPAPLPEAAPAAAPTEAEPEAPAAEEPAEPETPAPAEEPAPRAEPEPPAATDEPEAAPQEAAPAEEPEAPAPAEAPEAAPEEPAPAAAPEPSAAPEGPAPAAAPEPSIPPEEPSPSWPQPVYPDDPATPPEGAAARDPAATTEDAAESPGEPANPNWPQPVYPDGAPN
jgi:cytochrome c